MHPVLRYLKELLQLILAPSKGWEDISASAALQPVLINRCLYPTCAVAALSLFVQYFYHYDLSLAVMLLKAVVIFVSYFVAFYLALTAFRSWFGEFCDGEPNEHKYTLVVAYGICLLAVSTVVCNVLPVSFGLNYLLPLAVAMIMWKADAFLCVRKDRNTAFLLFCLVTTILPPMFIRWLFDIIL